MFGTCSRVRLVLFVQHAQLRILELRARIEVKNNEIVNMGRRPPRTVFELVRIRVKHCGGIPVVGRQHRILVRHTLIHAMNHWIELKPPISS